VDPPKKSARSQLVENSSCKFDPPCLLALACFFSAITIGFGEEDALQKICTALPIHQDNAY
jgi:hypothetical protein